ncbi:hypothetical protein H4R18_001277 [Coemansia javaensis]|uniref:ER membrane protein complex subunit 1 n=1 Tax=Coemansia javaensis TaxID=2761396 RepID=A0A9W8HLY6_9FUNG|nr:hypothetical protein H4R18_001277 [Coemansia javaensis]
MLVGRGLVGRGLAALAVAAQAALGLFPDEAGRIDWYRAQIGVPHALAGHTHNGTAALYAATERGVVAALDADSGSVRWRHVLDGEAIGALRVGGGRVLAQSAGGGEARVRVWDAHSGALQWAFARHANSTDPAAAEFVGDGSGDVVAVAGGALVRVGAGGEPAWELRLGGSAAFGRVVVAGGSAFAIGERRGGGGGGLRVVQAALADGARQRQYSVADGQALGSGRAVVAGAHVLWREDGDIVWRVHRLGATSPPWDLLHAKMVQEELAPEDMLTSTLGELAPGEPRFTLTYAKAGARKTVAIELDEGPDGGVGMRKLAALRTDGAAIGCGGGGGAALVAVSAADGAWRARGAGGERLRGRLAYDAAAHGPVVRAALVRTAAGGARAVAVTAGGLVLCGAPGADAALWARDEALAHATDMALVDLPPPPSGAERAAAESDPAAGASAAARYALRWAATARAVAAWAFGLLRGSAAPADAAIPATVGDHFGFRKLAVFGSGSGVVAALNTQGGARAWARRLADGAVDRVVVARRCQPLAADPPPVVVAVARSASANATVVAALHALTGAVLRSDTLPGPPPARVLPLPAAAADGQQLIALIWISSGAPALRVWPPTPDAARSLCAAAAATPLFFDVADDDARVRGFRIHCGADGDAPAALPAWAFALPPGETLAAPPTRYDDDAAHAAALLGRVLGDRSVLYKYLSPHVTTLAARRAAGGVAVYLLDRVSGRLLHSAVHAAARVGPDHPFVATQAENRVVYQLWHDVIPGAAPARGYVTVVADLYESDVPDARDARPAFSGLDLAQPAVVTAAFAAPGPATALAATRTASHITTRDVVFALRSGALLSLPAPLLDPRRPVGAPPTADEQAEGLVQYAAPLPLDPRRVLSHVHTVAAVRRVVSAPTHLESTALVAAYGLDLFFTRVTPSGSFDQLSPSFSKLNLAATTLALAAGCLLAAPMVRRQVTARAWA